MAAKKKPTSRKISKRETGKQKQKPQREVRLYTKEDCQYCDYARELLEKRGIKVREIDVGEDYVMRGWLAWATGQRTLPQIFIEGEPIGGFPDLMNLDVRGELETT